MTRGFGHNYKSTAGGGSLTLRALCHACLPLQRMDFWHYEIVCDRNRLVAAIKDNKLSRLDAVLGSSKRWGVGRAVAGARTTRALPAGAGASPTNA